jgi:hypothetical protein
MLFIDSEKAYDSVWKEVLYNILTEFDIILWLIRLIKICLNETYSKFHIRKNLSDIFPILKVLKQGDVLWPFLSNFSLEYAIRMGQ